MKKMIRNLSAVFYTIFLLAAAPLGAAEITLISPADNATVQLLNPHQKAYLAMPRAQRIAYFADEEKRKELKEQAGHHPLPVKLSWTWDGAADATFTVNVSTSPDLARDKEVLVTVEGTTAQVENLRIGQKYFWQVCAEEGGKQVCSQVAAFTTEGQAPRLLRFDGVPNVRDLGGWQTKYGKRVRQGMVYRTAGLNDNATLIYTKTREDWKAASENNDKLKTEYEKRLPRDERLAQLIKGQKDKLGNINAARIVPYALQPTWTVFRPLPKTFDEAASESELTGLRAIPETFMGAPAEKVTMDETGCFSFEKPIADAPAIFMQEFESAEDGYMQLKCAANQFWDVRVNGEIVFDRKNADNRTAVRLQIPVRQGKNLIAVSILGGATGWTWCCESLSKASLREISEEMIHDLEETYSKLWQTEIGSKPGKNRLSSDTRNYLVKDLGIHTDIDLRTDRECMGMSGSPMGEEANWLQYSSSAYASMQKDAGKEAFAKVFKIFLDEANYPLVFHCIAGQDRTGAVAFIINGLLGVDLEDLYKDWELSGFWNSRTNFAHSGRFDHLVAGFEKLPGDTMQAKIEHYVRELGFTDKDIEHLRALLLEN